MPIVLSNSWKPLKKPMGWALSGISPLYNKEFLNAHPDIVIDKKYDSPDEEKSLADSKALIHIIDFGYA